MPDREQEARREELRCQVGVWVWIRIGGGSEVRHRVFVPCPLRWAKEPEAAVYDAKVKVVEAMRTAVAEAVHAWHAAGCPLGEKES